MKSCAEIERLKSCAEMGRLKSCAEKVDGVEEIGRKRCCWSWQIIELFVFVFLAPLLPLPTAFAIYHVQTILVSYLITNRQPGTSYSAW